jgi:hypothetical protein
MKHGILDARGSELAREYQNVIILIIYDQHVG